MRDNVVYFSLNTWYSQEAYEVSAHANTMGLTFGDAGKSGEEVASWELKRKALKGLQGLGLKVGLFLKQNPSLRLLLTFDSLHS